MYDSYQGIFWPYYTWFLRILHGVEMKRGFILRNTSLGRSDTGQGASTTTEISEFSLSPSRKIHVQSMLLNPSQKDSAPKWVVPGDQARSTSWDTKLLPMLKLKDQSSRVVSTIKVYPLFSVKLVNCLNFSGGILFWCVRIDGITVSCSVCEAQARGRCRTSDC